MNRELDLRPPTTRATGTLRARAWLSVAASSLLLVAGAWSIGQHGVVRNVLGLALCAACLLMLVFALPACIALLRQAKPATEAVGPGYAIWTLTCALAPVMGLLAPVMLLGKLEVFVLDEGADAEQRARLRRARAPLLALALLLAAISLLTALGVLLL